MLPWAACPYPRPLSELNFFPSVQPEPLPALLSSRRLRLEAFGRNLPFLMRSKGSFSGRAASRSPGWVSARRCQNRAAPARRSPSHPTAALPVPAPGSDRCCRSAPVIFGRSGAAPLGADPGLSVLRTLGASPPRGRPLARRARVEQRWMGAVGAPPGLRTRGLRQRGELRSRCGPVARPRPGPPARPRPAPRRGGGYRSGTARVPLGRRWPRRQRTMRSGGEAAAEEEAAEGAKRGGGAAAGRARGRGGKGSPNGECRRGETPRSPSAEQPREPKVSFSCGGGGGGGGGGWKEPEEEETERWLEAARCMVLPGPRAGAPGPTAAPRPPTRPRPAPAPRAAAPAPTAAPRKSPRGGGARRGGRGRRRAAAQRRWVGWGWAS